MQKQYPKFVHSEDWCNWCGHSAKLTEAFADEKENTVVMVYQCDNKNCDHNKYFNRPNVYRIIDSGKGVVELFKKYEQNETSSKFEFEASQNAANKIDI